MTDEEVIEFNDILLSLSATVAQRHKVKVDKLIAMFAENVEIAEMGLAEKKYKDMRFSQKGYNPLEAIENATKAFEGVADLYVEAQSNLSTCDRETEDILHALELLEMTKEKEIELLEDLKRIRKVRRRIKEFSELISPIKDFVSKYGSFITKMQSINSSVQKISKRIKDRTYNPKVRNDLDSEFEKIQMTEKQNVKENEKAS